MSARNKLAVPELAAIEVRGMSREAFLARATIAAGAVYGIGAVGPLVRRALARDAGGPTPAAGDLDVLNFALTLEEVETRFYALALERVSLDSDTRRITEEIAGNEAEHAKVLRAEVKRLGGKPAPAPEVTFGDGLSSQTRYLELAGSFEETGVSAYNGAAPELESKKALAKAGSIVQIEGRHSALINTLRGVKAAPKAFDDGLTRSQIRERVEPYIVS